MRRCEDHVGCCSRREFLRGAGTGLGAIALATLLAGDGLLAAPHHAAKAKRVIFLFMAGGPSHLETFDPKPELQRLHGERLPASFGPVKTRRGVDKNKLMATRRTFSLHGASGMQISDLLASPAAPDDICLRGCHGDSVTHPESVYLMNTGTILMGRPSLGSWVTYGLGTENSDMPAFVVLPDPGGWVKGGAPAWGSGFLPAKHQGTVVRGGSSPILHLASPPGITPEQQRRTLDLVGKLNSEHARKREEDSELTARMEAYELAFRMQARAPDLVDVSRETEATRRLYGLDRKETAEFGLRCLLARRMVEARRAIRAALLRRHTNGWDAHSTSRRITRGSARRAISRSRASSGSQVTRSSRIDARHPGRRVRPHAHDGGDRPAATTTRTAFRCGSRRRREGRARDRLD